MNAWTEQRASRRIARFVPLLTVAIVAAGLSPTRSRAQTSSPQTPGAPSVYTYVLDYDVPESPAFAAMGLTPSNVLRGGAAKPIVVNTLTSVLNTGKLDGGLAVDFSPMVFAKPTFTSFNDYKKSFAGMILRRVLFSLGSAADEDDTSSLRVGTGMRVTLYDANDPLTNDALFERVNELLTNALPPAPPKPGQTGGGPGAVVTLVNKDSLAAAYKKAREDALDQPGWAASVGWGLAALVRGSVVDRDSITDATNNVWLSSRYKFSTPASILVTVQWHQIRGDHDDLRAGAALRADFTGVNAAAELVYDGFTHTLQPGGNAEIRILPGTRIALGISSDLPQAGDRNKKPKLRIQTHVKWDLAELVR